MSWEHISLNIIPAGEMPVFHCSQYENSRPINITLMAGEDFYTPPEGTIIELHEHKVDDNIVVIEAEEIDGYRVVFIADEQVTACPGDNICELWLKDSDNNTIGTLNFIIHVEADPIAAGLGSDSVIKTIDRAVAASVEEIAPAVIAPLASAAVSAEAAQQVGNIGGRWARGSAFVGDTSLTIRANQLTENSLIDVYSEVFGIEVNNIEVEITENYKTCTISFDALEQDCDFYIRYFNVGM